MTLPSRYGISSGGYKIIPKEYDSIDFSGEVGVHTERSPLNLRDGESPISSIFGGNTMPRFNGGLEPTDGTTDFGTALPDAVYHLASFTVGTSFRYIVAIRSTGWSYFAPNVWTSLGGSTSPAWDDNLYHVVAQGRFVAAVSPLDRLKSWDGNPAHPVQDLSSDAPKAKFIAMFGNRMVAAGITLPDGTGQDPNLLQRSADGDITNWTNADLGAGADAILPASGDFGSDPIIGLSTTNIGLLIYRANSIVLAIRTGINDQPFRYTTIANGIGPLIGGDSGQGVTYGIRVCRIVHAGAAIGDIFIGNDTNIYLMNSSGNLVVIGNPIKKALLTQRNLFGFKTVAAFNVRSMEYILSGPGGLTYVFDMAQFLASQKIIWRQVGTLANLVAIGTDDTNMAGTIIFSRSSTNTVTTRLVRPEDLPVISPGSVWESRVLGTPDKFVTLGRIHIPYELFRDNTGAYSASLNFTLYISTDGGGTWTSLGTATPFGAGLKRMGEAQFSANMRVSTWQFRIDMLAGLFRIPKITWFYDQRGRN